MDRLRTTAIVHELAARDELIECHVADWNAPAYVHRDHQQLAEDAAAGQVKPTVTTLLSPFDPLVWDRARASAMFGFDYRIECYTPAPKRQYGYYVLPILRRGELVGRLDAKAHRAQGTFEVKALYLEDGVRPSAALANDVAGAISACAAWHRTPNVVIRKTRPATLRRMLKPSLA
jgi:uncharacterized protein YcaQ